MILKQLFTALFVLLFVAMSCKKKDPTQPTDGIYRGVFRRILNGTDTVGTGVVHLAWSEANKSFVLSGDTSSNAPYSCNGSYTLMPGKIAFSNTAFIPEFTTDPFYDPFYVLDTLFDFEFMEPNFSFQLNLDTVKYRYDLSRF